MRRATGALWDSVTQSGISIHALHEESDSDSIKASIDNIKFQSTLSMRRATITAGHAPVFSTISIHALHEESDWNVMLAYNAKIISIHALHEESDGQSHSLIQGLERFQSTLSMRRATLHSADLANADLFQSTLSMRRATCHRRGVPEPRHFNPRSP